MVSSLPKYVSDDPDGTPSSRLYEGDLHSLLAHLSKLDQKVGIFGDKLNVVVQHLPTYASSWPPLGAGTSGPSAGARSAETSTPSHTGTTRDRHNRLPVQTGRLQWTSSVYTMMTMVGNGSSYNRHLSVDDVHSLSSSSSSSMQLKYVGLLFSSAIPRMSSQLLQPSQRDRAIVQLTEDCPHHEPRLAAVMVVISTLNN